MRQPATLMGARVRIAALFVMAASTACIQSIAPSNPYDPATPVEEQAKASIAGVVTQSAASAATALPLQQATLVLSGPGENAQPQSVVTDANGTFLFRDLVPGAYTLAVTQATVYSSSFSFILAPGQNLNYPVALTPIAADAGGTNIAHITGVAVKQNLLSLPAAQQDYSGIIVQLAGNGLRTVTDANGNFDFFVNPGTYDVTFTAPNYQPTARNGLLAPPNVVTNVDPNGAVVLLPNPGSITGIVQFQPGGAGGTVTVSAAGIGTITADANGNFSLQAAAGTYTVTVSAIGYDAQTVPGVVVNGGVSTAVGTITLPVSHATITGSVQLEGASDSSAVSIGAACSLNSNIYSTVTDITGAYQLTVPVVTGCAYTLTARRTGYLSSTQTNINVSANSTTRVPLWTIALQNGAFTLSGATYNGVLYAASRTVTVNLPASNETNLRLSEDSTFSNPSLGDVNYRTFPGPSTTFTLSSASDGLKTLYAQYLDASGVASNVFQASITLDTQAPTAASPNTPFLQIDSGTGYTNNANLTLRFAVTDTGSGVATMVITADGNALGMFRGPYASVLQFPLPIPTNGLHTIAAQFTDGAGNVTPAQSANVTVNTIPPAFTAFSIACNGNSAALICNSSVVTVQVSSPTAASLEVANNPAFTGETALSFNGNATVPWLLDAGDGFHTVYTRLTDMAGNQNTTSVQVTVKSQAPTAPVLLVNNGNTYTNNTNVTLTLSAVGAAQADVSNCVAFNSNCTTSGWFSLISNTAAWTLATGDGQKVVYALFRDTALNQTSTTAASIVLDTTPPTAQVTGGAYFQINSGATYTNNHTVTLEMSATDALSGLASVALSEDSTFASGVYTYAYEPSLSFSLSAGDGLKTIYARFTDAAGNTAATQNANITVSTAPPSFVQFVVACPGVTTSTTQYCNSVFAAVQIESATAVKIALVNDSGTTPTSYSYTAGSSISIPWVLGTGDGPHSVTATLTDIAGNQNSQTVSVVLDSTPPSSPSVTVVSLDPNSIAGYTDNANVQVTLSAVDANQMQLSNCSDFNTNVACNTSAWTAVQSPLAWTLNSNNGTETVYAQFRNLAQAQSSVASASIVLDTVAPTPGTLTVSTANGNNFVNSVSILVALDATGANYMQLSCSGQPAATQHEVAYGPLQPCVLSPANGVKSIYARFIDYAGNIADAPAGSVYLDTTAPSPPVIGTQAAVVNLYAMGLSSYPVALSVGSFDPNLGVGDPGGATFVYQLKGGSQYLDWTDCGTTLSPLGWAQDATCAPTGNPPTFGFPLNANVPNTLAIRARDRAGNVSADSEVQIVEDSAAPHTVRDQDANGVYGTFGSDDVASGSGYAIISWEPPSDIDVGGFFVYYGFCNSGGSCVGDTNPNDLNAGDFSSQGLSPINVGYPCSSNPAGDDCSYRLTGLSNGTSFYVSVAAYDKTTQPSPNMGPLAPMQSVTPATLVPRLVGNVPSAKLGNPNWYARGVVLRDGLVYATAGDATFTSGKFSVVDITDPTNPNVVGSISVTAGVDVYVQGSYAYVADASAGLVTVDISNPNNPNVVATHAAGATATAIAGQGSFLFLATSGGSAGTRGEVLIFTTIPMGASGSACNQVGNPPTPALPCLWNSWGAVGGDDYFGVAAQGNYLYALSGGNVPVQKVYFINVGDVNSIPGYASTANVTLSYPTTAIAVSGPNLYTSAYQPLAGGGLLNVYDITNVATGAMPLKNNAGISGVASKLAVHGSIVYAVDQPGIENPALGIKSVGSLDVVQVSGTKPTFLYGYADANYNPIDPNWLSNNGPLPGSVSAEGHFLAVGGGRDGLQVFSTTAVRGFQQAGTISNLAPTFGIQADIERNIMWIGNQTQIAAYAVTPAGLASLVANPNFNASYVTAAGGDTAIASDGSSVAGFRITEAAQIITLGTYKDPNFVVTAPLAVRWPYAFALGYEKPSTSVVRMINLNSYTKFKDLSVAPWYALPQCQSVAVYGNTAYATNGNSIQVIDIPSATTHTVAAGSACNGVLYGHYLYINPTSVYDVSNPNNLVQLGAGNVFSLGPTVSGNYLYPAGGTSIYDETNPQSPQILTTLSTSSSSAVVPLNNQVFTLFAQGGDSYLFTLQ